MGRPGGVEAAEAWTGEAPEVSSANDEWRAENDQLGRFIEDCCVLIEDARTRARKLYERYHEWAKGSGEGIMSETSFGNRLKARGFEKEHTRLGAEYVGIGIRTDAKNL